LEGWVRGSDVESLFWIALLLLLVSETWLAALGGLVESLPFGLLGLVIRLAFEPSRGLCHLPYRSGLRIQTSALWERQKTLSTVLFNDTVSFRASGITYQLEHVIDVLGWDGHAIVLDVEKAMCRSCVEHPLSDFL
jgi:hypothetical protein